MLYLKIENPGVCPSEGFTVFGASTKMEYSANPLVIGAKGSGNKQATLLLLRAGINPVIFCDMLRHSFFTRPLYIKGVNRTVQQKQVCVRYGGKDADGRSCTREEELSATLDYGKADWPSPKLALREYVSNGLDACFEMGMDVHEARRAVKVEVVDENQVRAKAGTTRVFVPLVPEVQEFYDNIGKWFLHFSEPEKVSQTVLHKGSRNLTEGSQAAVIYRRGVFVREFTSTNDPSLFDYNLNDLQLNESRTASDGDVLYYAACALSAQNRRVLALVFKAMREPGKWWEYHFPRYALASDYLPSEAREKHQEEWQAAFTAVAGEDAVLMDNNHKELTQLVEKKGYAPVATEALGWVQAGERLGLRSQSQVLTEDDMEGRTYSEATPAVQQTLDWVWALVEKFDMANGRSKPDVACFFKHMTGESSEGGLYKDGKVFIHTDFAQAVNEYLKVAMMHEVGHHCSGATDYSYDFNVWFNRFCVKMGAHITPDI